MKVQLFSMLVFAIAFASLTYTPSADEQPEPGHIDFASLHGQAASALQSLQSSQAQRVALAETTASAF